MRIEHRLLVSLFFISLIFYMLISNSWHAEEVLKNNSTQIESVCKGSVDCFIGKITKVTDGDTLEVDDTSIRLALVDTPEYNETGGSEARDFALAICPLGSTALVDEDDNQSGGSYDRTVGVVYCNNNNLNEKLLESGFATIDKRFCDVSEFANESWAKTYGC